MTTMMQEEVVSVRFTLREKQALTSTATLLGTQAGKLAAAYTNEGVRRSRFPAIEFRDGQPGRVAYLYGSRWPVWMVVDLVRSLGGNVEAAAQHLERPAALVKMGLAYAEAYPEEIEASLALHAGRDFAGLKAEVPELEAL
ncbi:MAG: hypothetical protein HZA90_12755 [Verrucomicrobia bacterium]|nr:hypothetical protein [Verrucomicrobiota bacterium]